MIKRVIKAKDEDTEIEVTINAKHRFLSHQEKLRQMDRLVDNINQVLSTQTLYFSTPVHKIKVK